MNFFCKIIEEKVSSSNPNDLSELKQYSKMLETLRSNQFNFKSIKTKVSGTDFKSKVYFLTDSYLIFSPSYLLLILNSEKILEKISSIPGQEPLHHQMMRFCLINPSRIQRQNQKMIIPFIIRYIVNNGKEWMILISFEML